MKHTKKNLYRNLLVLIWLILGILTTTKLPARVWAWDDCPLGETDDEYPGECPRYVDTDSNGICDRSEPAPQDRADTTATPDTTQDPITNSDINDSKINESDTDVSNTDKPVTDSEQETTSENEDEEDNDQDKSTEKTSENTNKDLPYNFLIPFLTTTLLYLVTWKISKSEIAKKNKILSKISFNGFWNTILAISLIPSFVFGIVLIMRYRFQNLRNINFDFLYWHVEGAIVMGTIGTMHLLTRLKQYFAQLSFIGKSIKE
jgi:cation transport ATPase